MSDDIDASGLYHFHRGIEETLDKQPDISLEMPLHGVGVFPEWAVYTDHVLFGDPVVQGQLLEIGDRGVIGLVQIINLQTGIYFQLIAVFLFQSFYLLQILRHIVFRHIPESLERKRRVGGKTVRTEPVCYGESHEILRNTSSITKSTMTMVVTELHDCS